MLQQEQQAGFSGSFRMAPQPGAGEPADAGAQGVPAESPRSYASTEPDAESSKGIEEEEGESEGKGSDAGDNPAEKKPEHPFPDDIRFVVVVESFRRFVGLDSHCQLLESVRLCVRLCFDGVAFRQDMPAPPKSVETLKAGEEAKPKEKKKGKGVESPMEVRPTAHLPVRL